MILNIVFFIIGFILSSFLISNALLCIFFSIPFTKKLEKIGVNLDSNSIIFKNKITITLDLGIMFLVSLIVTLFFTKHCVYFYISIIVVILLLIKNLKENPNNISDYFNTFKNDINFDSLNSLIDFYKNQLNDINEYIKNIENKNYEKASKIIDKNINIDN